MSPAESVVIVTIASLQIAFSVFIPIDNAGFEVDQLLYQNAYDYDDPILSHWTLYDPHSVTEYWSQMVVNPSGGTTFNDPVFKDGTPEGTNIGFLEPNSTSVGLGEVGLFQELTGNVVAAFTTYTLSVWVGDPAVNTWSVNSRDGASRYEQIAGFPGYKIQLFADDLILAQDDNSLSIPEAQWRQSVISITIDATNPYYVGKTLGIMLINKNLMSGGYDVAFDDVKLEAITSASTDNPAVIPTIAPSKQPTHSPTKMSSETPTSFPTIAPSKKPTNSPTKTDIRPSISYPSKAPSSFPTISPSKQSTSFPTKMTISSSTSYPSKAPSSFPTISPSKKPTNSPTKKPTNSPTKTDIRPSTSYPSKAPSSFPTISPSKQSTSFPTKMTISSSTSYPSKTSTFPTNIPSLDPTHISTMTPSKNPIFSTDYALLSTTRRHVIIKKKKPVTSHATAATAIYLVVGILIFLSCCSCILCFIVYLIRKRKKRMATPGMIMMATATAANNIIGEEQAVDRALLNAWFKNTVKLPQYAPVFINNGYESLQAIKFIENRSELRDLGITSLGHQALILGEIKKMSKETYAGDTAAGEMEITNAEDTRYTVERGAGESANTNKAMDRLLENEEESEFEESDCADGLFGTYNETGIGDTIQ